MYFFFRVIELRYEDVVKSLEAPKSNKSVRAQPKNSSWKLPHNVSSSAKKLKAAARLPTLSELNNCPDEVERARR